MHQSVLNYERMMNVGASNRTDEISIEVHDKRDPNHNKKLLHVHVFSNLQNGSQIFHEVLNYRS